MADTGVPYFCNDLGLTTIEVGSRKFMCIGAKPPYDHPHVYLELGEEAETICPYCATLYRYNPALADGAANPEACIWHGEGETAAAA